MAKALIVYATRSGETKKIAEVIGEGLRIAGEEAEIKPVTDIKKEDDLKGYDAYVLGAATYHGEMMESMKTLLFLCEKAGLEAKVGGAFGAFGWSGEAPERIFNTMKYVLNMNMVGDCLRLKAVSLQGGVSMAQAYGRDIAAKMKSS